MLNARDLDRRDLVLRAVSRPIGEVRGHAVYLRFGVMKGGVDHARIDPRRELSAQSGRAESARQLDPLAIPNAARFGILPTDFEPILRVPLLIGRAPCLRAHIVLGQNAPRRQQQREPIARTFCRRHEFGQHEGAAAIGTREALGVQNLGALRRTLVAWPLSRADPIQKREAQSLIGGREARDFVKDLTRIAVLRGISHGVHEHHHDFPVLVSGHRLHDLANAIDAAFGARERAVLLQRGATRQEDMSIFRRLVQKEIVHDHELHAAHRFDDVVLVRIAVHGILAHDVHPAEMAGQRRIEHVGKTQARLWIEGHAPILLERSAHGVVGDEAVAAENMRPAAEATSTLHIALAAKRIDAHALAAEHAARKSEVAEAHHARRPLRVFRDAEPIIDRAVRSARIEMRGPTDGLRINPRQRSDDLRRIAVAADESGPVLELMPLAARPDEVLIVKLLAHDDVRDAVENGDVGAGPQRQMNVSLEVRGFDRLGLARIDHDELGALANAPLHQRPEHRVTLGRIGANHHNDVGLQDRVKVLARRAPAHRGGEAELRRRVADARAVVDIIVAEHRAGELLREKDLFVGATRT